MVILKTGHYITMHIMDYSQHHNHGKGKEINNYKKMNKKTYKDIDICYYVK